MPGRGTDILYIHRLLTHISKVTGDSPGVVASLITEKPFDSVERCYLWAVPCKFGFGPHFIEWIHLLYNNPSAKVHTNDAFSFPFLLGRSTRQGCPLSLGLFTLAMEPLAAQIRFASLVKGIQLGWWKTKPHSMRMTTSCFSGTPPLSFLRR